MDQTTLAVLGTVVASLGFAIAASEILVSQIKRRDRIRERLSELAIN